MQGNKAWAAKTEAGGMKQVQEAKKQGQETTEQMKGPGNNSLGKKTGTGRKETKPRLRKQGQETGKEGKETGIGMNE